MNIHGVVKSNVKLRCIWLCAVLLVLALTACGEEAIREFFGGGYTQRDRYEQKLKQAGIDQTALGRDWLAAAESALDRAISILPPYLEETYLDPREVAVTAYQVTLRRGQRLEVVFESEPDSNYQVFIELFRAADRPDRTPRHITSADSLERRVDYLARRDGEYLIRIQPELLRGGRYTISIVVTPSLEFPVSGGTATDIGSWYGDPRDGGQRQHEGLDIFARRGTPVLAAADGVIRSTRSNGLGGNVIWLRDRYGRTHYYAHLESQAVRRGERVTVGDTIGFVGNSGNARTTPPHLHFGIYSSGSFDPYPAIEQLPTETERFSGDPNMIDQLVRVTRAEARIRAQPSSQSDILAQLPLHTPLQVEAGSGAWYRVKAPDGTVGFVATRLTESAQVPIRNARVEGGASILTDPAASAVAVDILAPGAEVPVLGTFGEFLFVEGPSGRVGWLALD